MNVTKFGYGLAAIGLALTLGLSACKSDKKSKPPASDAGGGDAAANKDAGGGSDSGPAADGGGSVTPAQCEAMTKTTTMNMDVPACTTCVCAKATAEALACAADVNCWLMIQCYATKCHDLANGMTDVACAVNATTGCGAYTAGITAASMLGPKIKASCPTECVAPSTGDGGTSNDAGGADAN